VPEGANAGPCQPGLYGLSLGTVSSCSQPPFAPRRQQAIGDQYEQDLIPARPFTTHPEPFAPELIQLQLPPQQQRQPARKPSDPALISLPGPAWLLARSSGIAYLRTPDLFGRADFLLPTLLGGLRASLTVFPAERRSIFGRYGGDLNDQSPSERGRLPGEPVDYAAFKKAASTAEGQ
jgi:hypothetical protein